MTNSQTDEFRSNILAVDDNPVNLRLLVGMLTQQGYKVRSVTNGTTALKAAQAKPPDLILLDIMMPEVDGYEVCKKLKTNEVTRNIPVIFISALDEALDKVQAFEAGGVDYISKPFQMEEVLVRIENQLHLRSLQQQLTGQNDRLQQEIEERQQAEILLRQKSTELEEFSASLKHLHRLNTTDYQDFPTLFADYLQTGCKILKFPTGIVSRVESQTYTVQASHSELDSFTPPHQLPLSATYCLEVVQQRKTIAGDRSADLTARIEERPVLCDRLTSQCGAIESYIGTPILVNGEIYGTLNFSSPTARASGSNAHEQEIIELMAQSLSKFVAAHQMEIERQRAEEETQLLLAVTQAIGSAPNFHTALEVTLQQVCQTTDWAYGEVWIPSLDGTALECAPSWHCQRDGIEPEAVALLEQFREYSQALTFLPNEELPGQVWGTGQSAWISDFSTELEDVFLRLELAAQCGLKAALGVPIVGTSDRDTQTSQQACVLAVLVFFTAESRLQDRRLSQVVSALGAQLGTVVQQKKAEAEMTALLGAMTDLVVVRDTSGYCLKIAPTNSQNLYRSPEEMLGKKIHEVLPFEFADRILDGIKAAVSKQQPVNIEYSLPINGKEVWLAETIAPLSDNSAILVGRDISDRKLLEEQIRQSEGKMRAVFEAMTDIVFIIDFIDGQIGNIDIAPTNPSRLYEGETNPIDCTIEQFFDEEGDHNWLARIAQTLATQQTTKFDYHLVMGEQSVWFAASIAPISATSVIWVARDISDRKTAEEALRISEERLILALEGSDLGLWDWNIATNEMYLSPEWQRMLGYDAGEIEDGISFWEVLLHPEDLPTAWDALSRHLDGATSLFQKESRMRTKTGEWKWILSHGKVFDRDATGKPVRMTGTHQDITERKRREEALQLIAQGTATKTGNEFFRACARYLAELLQVRYALITEWVRDDTNRVRTLAFWTDGNFSEEIEYDLVCTPCASVLTGKTCYYPDCVQERFPQDPSMERLGIQSYWGVPLIDSTGKVLGHLAVMDAASIRNDPTKTSILKIFAARAGTELERRLSEEALRESEERYRSLYNHTPAMLQSADAEFRLVSVSDYWLDFMGYSRQEVLGKKIVDFMTDKSRRSAQMQILPQFLATGTVKEIPYQFIRKNGQIADVLFSGIIERDGLGQVTRSLTAIVDVTERKRAELAVRLAQQKSERLLLNILPSSIANRLKQQTGAIAEQYDEVTIMFADIVGFTPMSARMSPIELVSLLNEIFSTFDQLADRYDLEKIKTIGDAYMVVGGLPLRKPNHAEAIADMALAVQAAMQDFRSAQKEKFQIRIGINTGSAVAGVIGIKKFIYDLWGDSVNVASRMESQGEPGRIQVTAATYEQLKNKYNFEKRGEINIKGKGQMTSYWLLGAKAAKVISAVEQSTA